MASNALQDSLASLGNMGNLALAQNVDFNTLLGFALGRYLKNRYEGARDRRLLKAEEAERNRAMADNIGATGNTALTVAAGGNTPENQWKSATLYQTIDNMKPTSKAGSQLKQNLLGQMGPSYEASLSPMQHMYNNMLTDAVNAAPVNTPAGSLFQMAVGKRLNPGGYGLLTSMY